MARRQNRQAWETALKEMLVGEFHMALAAKEADAETVLSVREPTSGLRYEITIRPVD
jgi:hypothetical protein